jgi:hypothetical protein
MNKEQIKAIVSEEAAKFSVGRNIAEMVYNLYFRLKERFEGTGVEVHRLNERYMIVGGMQFNFPRRKAVGHYTANVYAEA